MRTRVVDPHNHGRFFVRVLGVGLLLNLAFGTAGYFDGVASPPFALILAVVLVGLVFPRHCQHALWCLAFGSVLGVIVFAVPILFWTILSNGWNSVFRTVFAWPLLWGTVSAGAFCGFTFLIWMLFYRHLLVRDIEQDGTMCPNCGYCVNGLPSNNCPECGKSFDPLRLAEIRDRPLAGKMASPLRLSLWALALIVGATTLGYHWYRGALVTRSTLLDRHYWMYLTADDQVEKGEWFHQVTGGLQGQLMTPEEFRSVAGSPDLFLIHETGTYYIYKHRYRNGLMGVMYVELIPGKPVGLGYNLDGVNDHSQYRSFDGD